MKRILFIIVLLVIFLPQRSWAFSVGESQYFNIESDYDLTSRDEALATLKKIGNNAYFYVDNSWWSSLSFEDKSQAMLVLDSLSQEFDTKIYPILIQNYGDIWKPGIDRDIKITVLLHPIKEGAAGYFNSGDEYSKIENPNSNEREMIYLNTKYIGVTQLKSFLAHEFTHLITFNQKEKIQGVSEEVWLNEARAEYASTLLGYDKNYQGSNLEQRVKQFINSSSNSLTEWQNQEADYGVINLFTQYLVDHYGVKILTDSLHSSKVGISSINEALKTNNFQKDFSQIFTDWQITLFINSCQTSSDYCYINENLRNFRITPSLIFLPSTQRIGVSLDYSIKQWSGNWYRIIGGSGDLTLQFNGENTVNFKIPYVLCRDSGFCEVHFLSINKDQDGEIFLPDFDKNWRSLTLIPSIQSKLSGFGMQEPFYPLSISISIKIKTQEDQLRGELLIKIEELKKEIARLQQLLGQPVSSCQSFSMNLYYGMTNSKDVKCLQEFLISKGYLASGLNTSYFGPLTKTAVMAYQTAKSITPVAGYFGPLTRTAANKEL